MLRKYQLIIFLEKICFMKPEYILNRQSKQEITTEVLTKQNK